MARSGGCLCGAVRYRVDGEPLATAVCHCRHCQRQTGSAFSVMIAVRANGLSSNGEILTYMDRGESGGEVARDFCGTCGSPLFSRVLATPGVIYIKAGTLDGTDRLVPNIHVWTSSAQKWVAIDPAAQCFQGNAG